MIIILRNCFLVNCKNIKKLLLVLLLISSQLIGAQSEKITQELKQFTKVKGFDGLFINLIKSDVNRAVITGANTRKVNIINNKGVLKLRMGFDKIFSGYRTFIDLYYTEEIYVIDINEDARITSKEVIKQTILELKSQEGGEIDIDIEVEQLLAKIITGAVINISGVSNNQNIHINTGGTYNALNFKTKITVISINAGGNASIYATDYVKAEVKVGGEVKVYGNPVRMDKKTFFGGKITKL